MLCHLGDIPLDVSVRVLTARFNREEDSRRQLHLVTRIDRDPRKKLGLLPASAP